jgi:hypothetical protein
MLARKIFYYTTFPLEGKGADRRIGVHELSVIIKALRNKSLNGRIKWSSTLISVIFERI